MSPYRESQALTVRMKRTWRDIWNCWRGRHELGRCVINCRLEECEHKQCVWCGNVHYLVHIKGFNEPNKRDLFSSLAWNAGCAHRWEVVIELDGSAATQQCARCEKTRDHRFPDDPKGCAHFWLKDRILGNNTEVIGDLCRQCNAIRFHKDT